MEKRHKETLRRRHYGKWEKKNTKNADGFSRALKTLTTLKQQTTLILASNCEIRWIASHPLRRVADSKEMESIINFIGAFVAMTFVSRFCVKVVSVRWSDEIKSQIAIKL